MRSVIHNSCLVAMLLVAVSGAYAGVTDVQLYIEYAPVEAISDGSCLLDVTAVVKNLQGEPVVNEQVRFVEEDNEKYSGTGYLLDNTVQLSNQYTTRTDKEGKAHATYKTPKWSPEMARNPIELGVWYHVDGGGNPYTTIFVLAARAKQETGTDDQRVPTQHTGSTTTGEVALELQGQQIALLPLQSGSRKALSFIVDNFGDDAEDAARVVEHVWVVPVGFDAPVRMALVRNLDEQEEGEESLVYPIDLSDYADLAAVTPTATPISANVSCKAEDEEATDIKTTCSVSYQVKEGANQALYCCIATAQRHKYPKPLYACSAGTGNHNLFAIGVGPQQVVVKA